MAQKPSTTAENYEWILRVVDEFRLIDVKSYTLTLSLSLYHHSSLLLTPKGILIHLENVVSTVNLDKLNRCLLFQPNCPNLMHI